MKQINKIFHQYRTSRMTNNHKYDTYSFNNCDGIIICFTHRLHKQFNYPNTHF